jgi:hypothetical protein
MAYRQWALLKFESPKVIELRGFGVPIVFPQGPPMVSNEINPLV